MNENLGPTRAHTHRHERARKGTGTNEREAEICGRRDFREHR